MNKNFLWKFVLIVGTLLFFLFGIFGKPSSFSRQGLLDALADHIHLGLDLKGGTHLILQVQVNDAVNVVAQNAVEVLKEQLRARKIDYTDALSDGVLGKQAQDCLRRHLQARSAEQSRPDRAQGRATQRARRLARHRARAPSRLRHHWRRPKYLDVGDEACESE